MVRNGVMKFRFSAEADVHSLIKGQSAQASGASAFEIDVVVLSANSDHSPTTV
jgi:hypothetical protein